MPINIDQVRNDTPHCKDKLFFNSAGSSLPPWQVNNAIIGYLKEEERVGGYKLAELRSDAINSFYSETASMLNCKPQNIAFTYNSTDSYARALSSVPMAEGDVIITTDNDYISNYIAFISLKQRFGIKIERIRHNDNYGLDLDHLEMLIKKYNPIIVSISHIPTNSGLVQDIEGAGKVCQRYGTLYIVDACQSAGQLPLDVKKIQCDFLCSAGRKFLRGPRGTGFLYVSDKVLSEKMSPLFLDMRGAMWTGVEELRLYEGARRFEMWEFNYANLLGLKEAIKYGNDLGWDNIHQYNQELISYARQQLTKVDRVVQYDRGKHLSNIITIRIKGCPLEEMKSHLDQRNVYYSVSMGEYNLLDFAEKGIDWAIRLSPHIFNTNDEINQLCRVLKEMKK